MDKQWHGMPVSELRSPDGASVTVADHGAHLLSWTPAVGGPALYLSECSEYGAGNAIRGGVPVIFPQFSTYGSGKRHGFARTHSWHREFSGVEQGWAVARYSLNSKDTVDTGWPHQCELAYEVACSGQELRMSLTVHNPSDHAWEFAAALHTYLHVSDIDGVAIAGLQGKDYLDQTQAGAGALVRQDMASLRIAAEVDRLYLAVTEPIVVTDGNRIIAVQKQGFKEVVVWNPWSERAAKLTDMAPHDYHSFLCIEAAVVTQPVRLARGETWHGTQSVTITNK